MPTNPQWVQLALVPPPAVELRVLLGAVGGSDHLQAQLEAYSASDGVLIAMDAWPHCSIARRAELFAWMAQRLDTYLLELLSPF